MTKLALALALALGLSSTAAAADRVTCKDGTTSVGGRGACRGHGGVITPAHERASTKAKRAAHQARASVSKARREASESKDRREAKDGREASESKDRREASPRRGEPSHRVQARAPEGPLRRAEPTRQDRSRGSSTDAAGAIARCADGTYSHASTHSGACSSHGGVAEWMDKR